MNLSWIILCLGLLSAGADKKHLQLVKPKIIRQYKPCTPGKPSAFKCVLQCSVTNAPNAILTIFNGTSIFSIIKVADLNIDLSLCMEVQHEDTNPYRCVVDNTHSSQAVHFNVCKLCEPCPALINNTIPVTEEESVTLHTNVTKEQAVSHIMWRYECNPDEMVPIAEILNNITSISDCDDGRFKDRLHTNSQTGDLTITNTSKGDSGVFKLQINNGVSKCWSFNVTVYALLPVPVITRNSSSSTDSRCSVLCSVANVSAASLSWYKGNRSLSSISVSDLSINLSLPLEVKYQDNNTYSCVVNNPVRNKTTPLDISNLCPGLSNPIRIICIVAGVLAVVVLLTLLVAYFIHKHWKSRNGAGSQNQTSQNLQTDDKNQDPNSQNPQTDESQDQFSQNSQSGDGNPNQNNQNPQTGAGGQNQTSQNPQTANPSKPYQAANESTPLISSETQL